MTKTLVVVPWDGSVDGLGSDAGPMPLLGTTLEAGVRRAAGVAGFEVATEVPPGRDCLVVEGGTALGPKALEGALAAGRQAGEDLAFRLDGQVGVLLDSIRPGATGSGLWFLVAHGDGALEHRLARAQTHAWDPAERPLELGWPGGDPFPVTDRLVLPVRHWVHLLWANLLGMGPHLWASLVGRSIPLAMARITWAMVRTLSARPEVLASQFNRISPGAQVHRTAVVEGAVLGPGARVGAGAVVRWSILGSGAVVEDLAVCESVVAGPGARVQRQGMAKYSVLGEGAQVAGAVQLSVLGANASVKRGSYLMDQGLDGAVRVRMDGELVPAPMGMAGVCLGPGAALGSGVWIAPGRVIAPGTVVATGAALVHPDVPDGEGPYVVADGRLVTP